MDLLRNIYIVMNRVGFVLGLVVMVLVSGTVASGDIVLDNGSVTLSFDEATFVLKQFEGEGATYSFSPDRSPLWTLTLFDTTEIWVDVDDLVRLDSRMASQQSYGLSDSTGGRKLTLRWSNIDLFGTGALSVAVEVFLPQGEAASLWRIMLHNTSDRMAVFSVDFPYVSLNADYSGGYLDALAYPAYSGALFTDPAQTANITVTNETDVNPNETGLDQTYPGNVSLQYFHVYDGSNRAGLFWTPLDMAGFLKRYNLKGNGNSLACFIRHYPENNHLPGRSYALPYDVLIRPLQGDWIDGAKFYRALISDAPWMSHMDLRPSQHEEDSASLLPLNFIVEWNDFAGNPELALEVVEHYSDFFSGTKGVGIHIRWWWDVYLFEGTISGDLLQFISALGDSTTRVILYSSTRDWREGMWPDPRAEESVALNINGIPYFDTNLEAYIMDPASEAWQNLYVSKVTELLQFEGVSDMYMDNYPIPRLCYQPDHGHVSGGGTYWIDGYRDMCEGIKTLNPGVLLTSESRSEILLPWMNFFPVEYWATGTFDGPFVPFGSMPIPMVACVYHDFVGCTGSTFHPWGLYGQYQFTFQNGYAFVNGNRLSLRAEPQLIQDFPPQKDQDWRYAWKLTRFRAAALEFLAYGEWMRPPTLSGFPTVEVEFPSSYPSMYQRLETPSVLAGAFQSRNGMMGFAFTNFTDGFSSGTVSIRPSDYDMKTGPYMLYGLGMGGSVTPLDTLHDGNEFEFTLQMEPYSGRFLILTEEIGCVKGDVNDDGEVDIFDLVLTGNIIIETHTPTPEEACAADYNNDESIDLLDMQSMVTLILGRGSTK